MKKGRDISKLMKEPEGANLPRHEDIIGVVELTGLDKEQQDALTLIPVKPSQLPADEFEGLEHKAIGDRAYQFFVKLVDAKTLQSLKDYKLLYLEPKSKLPRIVISEDMRLTFGDIVALAGDFYGEPDEPISLGRTDDNNVDKKARFKKAYGSLVNANREEMHALLEQINVERDALEEAIRQGKKPSIGLEKALEKGNYKYGTITKYTFLPCSFLYSRYIDLAKNNFDHFGKEAKEAYRIGHMCALEKVAEAKLEPDKKRQMELLRDAIVIELFADHFKTDLYASGHMRTPRKGIADYVKQKGWTPGKMTIAGLLAKEMHDEDNHTGLSVHNRRGDKWEAYGDACYFDPENKDNRDIVSKAVAAGLVDLIDHFIGKPSAYNFEDYLPIPDDDNPNNPLFIEDEHGVVRVRPVDGEEAANCTLASYQEKWSPVKVLCRLKARQAGAKVDEAIDWVFTSDSEEPDADATLTKREVKALKKELKEIYSDPKDVAIRVGDEPESSSCVVC